MPILSHLFHAIQFSFVVAANAFLFGMVYKWLPKKDVGWTEALRGGLLVAVIWELGRVVLGMFLIGMQYTSAYGVIGSFIAILLWCYYGMSIIFFGAEYVQVLQRRNAERLAPIPIAELPIESNPSHDLPSAVPATNRHHVAVDQPRRPRIRPRQAK